MPPIATERVIDTLVLARRKHPGGHNTLDDLCTRPGVDRSRRTQHAARRRVVGRGLFELVTTRQAALQLGPIRSVARCSVDELGLARMPARCLLTQRYVRNVWRSGRA